MKNDSGSYISFAIKVSHLKPISAKVNVFVSGSEENAYQPFRDFLPPSIYLPCDLLMKDNNKKHFETLISAKIR